MLRSTAKASLRCARDAGATVAGLLSEAYTTTAAVTRYLDGFSAETPRLSRVPAPRRHDTPVLLVHGLCANKSYWAPLENQLLADGHTVCSVNYNWLNSTVADCGRHVADDAARLLEVTGADSLHVVGHSLGGVVAKWAMHHTDLAHLVRTGVSLGSPHRGAPLAAIPASPLVPLLGSLIGELRPGHPALDEQDAPLPAGVNWLTVGGGLDVLVPAARAALPGQRPGVTEHHTFDHLGHIAMVTHRQVTRLVRNQLAGAAADLAAA